MPNSKNYDLDIDTTLGGNNASDYIIPSQKAIKTYVDNNSGGGGSSTDVQINGTSITSGGVANILTNTAYDASSNKIATMSDVPADEIFIATYGTTTYQEVLSAYNAGKMLFAQDVTNNIFYTLSSIGSVTFTFSLVGASAQAEGTTIVRGLIKTILVSSNGWSILEGQLQSTYYLTTSINSSSTDTQYPSAKCVYDQLALKQNTTDKVTSINSSSTDTQYPSAKSVIELLKTIYPVGSVYLSTNSTCPLSSLFGTWTLVSSGRALWTGTGSNGNTTIAAGLPNITGQATLTGVSDAKLYIVGSKALDAFGSSTSYNRIANTSAGSANKQSGINIDASRSSTIYSDSVTTVQPPAYVVNVWRRTA